MGFLQGRRILVTGMLSNRSIAYGIAKACKREGAELAFCDEAGISDWVTFHGFCDQQRVGKILERADLFVLATDYEGLPKSLLEAMAIGTPCLVSDVAPLNHYVQDGVTGYRVGNTAEEWAAKLDTIIRDRSRSVNISRQARKFVERHHSADEGVLQYREQFEKLISGASETSSP